MQQFVNLSSWREDNIEIKAGEVYQLSFIDTKPNMFYVQNPNYCKLKVSISKIPTKDNYEFLINENSSEPLGRPIPTGYLYLLNTGTVTANVKVYSIADKFDMNILKNFTVQLDGVTLEASENIGFKDGVSLPSGTNNIGVVSLESAPTENLKTIADNSTGIEKTLDSNLLAIKNNVVGCADNSRDILWQLDGRTEVTGEKRQLVKEIADGIKTINDEGIGAQINGDVYLDSDMFWKKETENVFESLGNKSQYYPPLNAKIKIPNINSITFPDIDLLNNSSVAYELQNTGGGYLGYMPKVELTFVLKQGETTVKSVAITVDIEEQKYILINAVISALTTETGLSIKDYRIKFISDIDYEYFANYTKSNISGILYDMNRITDFSNSGMFTIPASGSKTLGKEFAFEGQKMWDKIEFLKSNSDTLIAKIYFTPTEYFTINNLKTMPIQKLDIPVYAITFSNNETEDKTCVIIGGAF